MTRNGKLMDIAILFVFSFLLNLAQFDRVSTLLATCLALSLASLSLFDRPLVLQTVICFVLALAAIFWPPMVGFLGLIVYLASSHRRRVWLLLLLLPAMLVLLQSKEGLYMAMVMAYLLLAAWLSLRTYKVQKISVDLLEAKNKYRELQLHYQSDLEQWEALRLSEAKTATLEERARIAREMHDSVGHVLTRAILQAAALNKLNKDESLQAQITSLEETLASGMTQTRASLHQLRDQAQDLFRELDLLCQSYPETPFSIKLHYDLSQLPPVAYQQAFLASVKEALTNVQRHSSASKVEVRLREYPAFYQLVVQDNGPSRDMAEPDETLFKEGMGLENMRLRCDALGGNFVVRKKNGFGIFMTLPKQENVRR